MELCQTGTESELNNGYDVSVCFLRGRLYSPQQYDQSDPYVAQNNNKNDAQNETANKHCCD